MNVLLQFKETLEQRVADRTALAEQRAEELAMSVALYRSLVDHLPLHVNRKDLQGRFTFVNDSFCQFLGKSRAELMGKTNFDFFPAEVAEAYQCHDKEVIEKGIIFRSLERLCAADGTPWHLEMLKTPVRSGNGEIVETQTVYLDVTDRVEAERRLVRSERLAAIGNVVAGVAHESRNALQQMQACTGLLEWKINDDPEAQALLADLQKAQDRLRRLFEDLRGYAAPMTLDVREYDLQKAVDEAWAALAQMREGRKATLEVRATAADCALQGRSFAPGASLPQHHGQCPKRVRRPGPGRGGIYRGHLAVAPATRVTIRDNGPGFTPQQRQQAFEPFYTTKTQGTGLGLAIVKRIVEAHEGEISLGNGRSSGAEIRILLPKGKP